MTWKSLGFFTCKMGEMVLKVGWFIHLNFEGIC